MNTPRPPKDIELKVKAKVSTVDATKIALDAGIIVAGIPVVNTPILGSIPKILDRVTLKAIQDTVKEKWKGELANKNVKATQDAFDQVEVKS